MDHGDERDERPDADELRPPASGERRDHRASPPGVRAPAEPEQRDLLAEEESEEAADDEPAEPEPGGHATP